MIRPIAAIAIAALASASTAQTGTYLWEVSNNNGGSWTNYCVPLPGQAVKVRVRAFWSGVTGPEQGYAGGQFDVTLTNATAADFVSNIQRPAPFDFSAQTLLASTYAGGLKIDTAADVAAPGTGTGWVNPGQAPNGFPNGDYNTVNGAVIFQFDILCNGFSGDITVGAICNTTTGRAMAIYANPGGTQVRMNASQVSVQTALIGFPTPGPLALLGLGGLAAMRRRRPTTTAGRSRECVKAPSMGVS